MLAKTIHSKIEKLFSLYGHEGRFSLFIKQLFLFGYLQALSCIFPLLIFIFLAISSLFPLPIARYDLLLLIFILIQVIMYLTGLESRNELLVITLFHLLGILLEVHKVNQGSWSYPEAAYTKVWNVPLYAGFMYASVGSYICQAWKNLKLGTVHWPSTSWAIIGGLVIYLNFFTNSLVPDARLYIAIFLIIVFRKTKFSFVLNERRYLISALISFLIIGGFIWLAENIATFFGAWKYAYQHQGWKMVKWHKITSWGLLVIVSIIIVVELKKLKQKIGMSDQAVEGDSLLF